MLLHRQYIRNKSHNNDVKGRQGAFSVSFVDFKKETGYHRKDSKTINKKSNTICVDDYDKTMLENKYISNKNKKFKSNKKNISYNKIIGLIPNSRFPLSSKHQTKNSTPSLPKKFLQRDKSSVSHSALIINRK